MLERVAQCTSTQLNPLLFFVRKRYWVLCGKLAKKPLIHIEKFVRNITDLETFFVTVIFQVTTFLAIQKYTSLMIFVGFRSQNFATFNRRKFSSTIETRHY